MSEPIERSLSHRAGRRVSRRGLLRAVVGGGVALSVGSLLTACGGSSDATPTSSSQGGAPTSAASATSSTGTGAGTPAAGGGSAEAGGELIYGLTNRFDTLDPNVTTFTDVGRIAIHIFDPLVWQPSAGEFVPGLAEKWEVATTADEYTFHLRSGVKFHDGTDFNAEAVKFTWDRIVDPELKSQTAFSLIGPYDSSEVVDPLTVTAKFKTAFAPFLGSCSGPNLAPVSPAAVQQYGPDFGTHPVGTGPFKFESYETDNQVRLVRNPDYNWGPSFLNEGPALLDAITWRIIPEPATRVAALKSGEVLFIQDVPTQDVESLKGDSSLTVLEAPSAGSGESMMINVTREPTNDVRVRQALQWGVDKQGMNQAVWRGLYQPTNSPLSANMFGYDPATEDMYSYDPEKAGALLDEAGWTLDGDVRKKDGQELVLGLYYRSDNADSVAMATFLQAMYAAIGVKVELNGLAQAGYFNAVRAGEHHLQFWWESATDPDVLRILFHSSNADGGTNRNRYKDAEMDQLLDQAAGSTDPEVRKQLYAQIQKKALDEAIMVFFANVVNFYAYQKGKVEGVYLDWSGNFPLFHGARVTA